MMTALESLKIVQYNLAEEIKAKQKQYAEIKTAISEAREDKKERIFITKQEANELMGYKSDNIYRFKDIPWNNKGMISLKEFENWAWNKKEVKARIKTLRKNIKRYV